MWFYIWVFIGSTSLFLVWSILCSVEHNRQQRVLLPGVRSGLDAFGTKVFQLIATRLRYISRYFLTLGWYYSIHALLKTCLRCIANMYFVLEHMFEKNRARTKQLRREQRQQNPYFTELNEHKSNVALTKSKQQTLKKRALDGK